MKKTNKHSNPERLTNMGSLAPRLSRLEIQEGYKDEFRVIPEGLKSLHTGNIYQPKNILSVKHYRFEGISNPDDNEILYAIETDDGVKGTLIDAYGMYADSNVASFMEKLTTLQNSRGNKKTGG